MTNANPVTQEFQLPRRLRRFLVYRILLCTLTVYGLCRVTSLLRDWDLFIPFTILYAAIVVRLVLHMREADWLRARYRVHADKLIKTWSNGRTQEVALDEETCIREFEFTEAQHPSPPTLMEELRAHAISILYLFLTFILVPPIPIRITDRHGNSVSVFTDPFCREETWKGVLNPILILCYERGYPERLTIRSGILSLAASRLRDQPAWVRPKEGEEEENQGNPQLQLLVYREAVDEALPRVRAMLSRLPIRVSFEVEIKEHRYKGKHQFEVELILYRSDGRPINFIELLLTNGTEVLLEPDALEAELIASLRASVEALEGSAEFNRQ